MFFSMNANGSVQASTKKMRVENCFSTRSVFNSKKAALCVRKVSPSLCKKVKRLIGWISIHRGVRKKSQRHFVSPDEMQVN